MLELYSISGHQIQPWLGITKWFIPTPQQGQYPFLRQGQFEQRRVFFFRRKMTICIPSISISSPLFLGKSGFELLGIVRLVTTTTCVAGGEDGAVDTISNNGAVAPL